MSKQETMTSAEFKKQAGEKPKESKYKNNPRRYNGIYYQSTKEANYAATLDILKNSGHISKWERQLSYKLGFNDVYITEYKLDFKIWWSGGAIDHIDVKGVKKGVPYDLFKVKKALMKACYSIDVIEV